jgi:hypothetical protein
LPTSRIGKVVFRNFIGETICGYAASIVLKIGSGSEKLKKIIVIFFCSKIQQKKNIFHIQKKCVWYLLCGFIGFFAIFRSSFSVGGKIGTLGKAKEGCCTLEAWRLA